MLSHTFAVRNDEEKIHNLEHASEQPLFLQSALIAKMPWEVYVGQYARKVLTKSLINFPSWLIELRLKQQQPTFAKWINLLLRNNKKITYKSLQKRQITIVKEAANNNQLHWNNRALHA
jgi:hypothetical protein